MTGINRQPSGLQDFLQVQSGGRNPDDLSQTVRPVIDIEQFYWPDRIRAAVEPFSMTVTQIEFIEVPAGQVWKLFNVTVEVTNTAINTVQNFSCHIERLPGQGLNGVPFANFGGADTIGQTNGVVCVYGKDLNPPRILTAGQRLTIRYDNGDVTPVAGNLWANFILLQD